VASIFSKIVAGEIPCYKLAEDEQFLAFLDINPVVRGHALVIPKIEIDYYFDLSDELLSQSMIFAKKVASCIKEEVTCKRIGISVVGLEVPHAHIHLIPINNIADMSFTNPRKQVDGQEMTKLATRIWDRFNQI